MTASTPTNTKLFTFKVVLVFKLLSHKDLYAKKTTKTVKKYDSFKKKETSRVVYCNIGNSWNAKFSGYF